MPPSPRLSRPRQSHVNSNIGTVVVVLCSLTVGFTTAWSLARHQVPWRATAEERVKAPKAQPRTGESGWALRHLGIKRRAMERSHDVLLLGDSITQGWAFSHNWSRNFPHIAALNAGISSDRVEHVLWRVKDGLLTSEPPRVVVLLAGVNNLALNTPKEIALATRNIIGSIKGGAPKTQILLLGVFPTGPKPADRRRARVEAVNRALAPLGHIQNVSFVDIGSVFLETDRTISRRVMYDSLHLTPRGYDRFALAIKPHLQRLLDLTPTNQLATRP